MSMWIGIEMMLKKIERDFAAYNMWFTLFNLMPYETQTVRKHLVIKSDSDECGRRLFPVQVATLVLSARVSVINHTSIV